MGGRCPAVPARGRRQFVALFPSLHPPWPPLAPGLLASLLLRAHTPGESLRCRRNGVGGAGESLGAEQATFWNLLPSGPCCKVRAPQGPGHPCLQPHPTGHLQIRTCKSSSLLLRCPLSSLFCFSIRLLCFISLFLSLTPSFLVLSDSPFPRLYSTPLSLHSQLLAGSLLSLVLAGFTFCGLLLPLTSGCLSLGPTLEIGPLSSAEGQLEMHAPLGWKGGLPSEGPESGVDDR